MIPEMADTDLDRWRSEFPILQTATYLISNSLGAMPAAAEVGLDRYVELWGSRGVRAWTEEWWTLGDELADAIAPILGAVPATVSMQPNVSLATALVLSGLEGGILGRSHGGSLSRDKVVTTDLQFPSVRYVLERWCERQGLRLETVEADTDFGSSTERLLEAIDDQTLCVAISHVEFKTAWIHDARVIADHCRRKNAFLLLDVFQSAGTLPLELAAWGVDAAVGGCLKWLCGGPGNAFLYVAADRAQDLQSTLTGWMSHPRPFAFEPPPLDSVAGRRRFLHGTPPIPAFYAARPGVDILTAVGADTVRERSLELTGRLLDRAAERGWSIASPREAARRGGTVTLDLPHAAAVSQELSERDIIVDYRPGAGIRISPHFYNTVEECDYCLETIAEILEDDSWQRQTPGTGETPT